jgi:Cu(I)/Ag(I) efflux system membrane fusion protein
MIRRTVLAVIATGALVLAAGCGGSDDAQVHPQHDQTAHQMLSARESVPDTDGVITRYRCPMHPDFIRDEPGSCGICGMELVPFTIDTRMHRDTGVPGRAMVMMDQAQRQLIGVRTSTVQRLSVTKRIRTVGRVVPDERRTTHIHTKFSGWVEKLYADYTGQVVRRGDPVLDIYSPELVAAQQEYLIAYQTNRTGTGGADLVRVARQRLKLLDMTDEQIARLEQTGTPQTTLTIFAPHDGTIIEKSVNAGHQVSAATILYSIADLSRVWVLADAYEGDLPLVKVGQTAVVTMSSAPGGPRRGRVTFVSPVMDVTTRTAPFRMEFTNPDGNLRPGAFVDVELEIPLGERLVTPRESILDSGTRQVAFVETEPGMYEPREVTLGVRTDGLVEVLSGLHEGEKVVTSATFFIDSESQLRAAVSGAVGGHSGHQH